VDGGRSGPMVSVSLEIGTTEPLKGRQPKTRCRGPPSGLASPGSTVAMPVLSPSRHGPLTVGNT